MNKIKRVRCFKCLDEAKLKKYKQIYEEYQTSTQEALAKKYGLTKQRIGQMLHDYTHHIELDINTKVNMLKTMPYDEKLKQDLLWELLPSRCVKMFKIKGITTYGDLVKYDFNQLLEFSTIGKTSLFELYTHLQDLNIECDNLL